MHLIEKCLFIGNGLNRCLKNSISWGKLLENIASDLEVSYCNDTPMPMEFERMANEYMAANPENKENVHDIMKKTICERLNNVKLPPNAIHYKLSSLPLNAIITTNYDFLLEYIFNPEFNSISGNKKYLFDKTSIQKGIAFYHAHGSANQSKSLCLGYEHYMGIVQKLRTELNTKENNKKENMEIYKILSGESGRKDTWGERFYTSNISFIGFELNECEADIWWLLTHRAYLFYSNYCGVKSHLNNRIIFYDILDYKSNSNSDEEKKRIYRNKKIMRHRLLEKENVLVRSYNIGKDCSSYEEAYEKIIDDIRKEE